MTIKLYCKVDKKVTKHAVNQENGEIRCHICSGVFGKNRMVAVRHEKNRPIPRDYEGHEVALLDQRRKKPRDRYTIKNGIWQ